MKEEKGRLRQIIKAQRGLLDIVEWQESSIRIIQRYCAMEAYQKADIVLAYVSIGREVDMTLLHERCWQDGKRLAVPRVTSAVLDGGEMEFVFLEPDSELKEKFMGIREPQQGEIFQIRNYQDKQVEMILPGLCFDLCGGRIGYGGGYYDRYLASEDMECVHKSVLAFDFQLMDPLPLEDQDVGYDLLITDKRYYIY